MPGARSTLPHIQERAQRGMRVRSADEGWDLQSTASYHWLLAVVAVLARRRAPGRNVPPTAEGPAKVVRHAALTEPCWPEATVGLLKIRWSLRREVDMIPTMIVFGLVFGRWWKLAIAVGAVLWPTILVFTGVIGVADVLGAAALGALNTAVGIAVHQVALWLVRSIRRDRPAPSTS